MTIAQLADAAGCSERTVRRTINLTMPGRMENGKATRLDQYEARAIMDALPKRNTVGNLGQMAEVPRTKVQGDERIERLETLMAAQIGMVEHLCKALAAIPGAIAGQRLALPDIEQDYFTIKGWAARMGEKITYSEAIALGKSAKRLSVERDIEVRKADDEKYGYVGSYHRSILEDAFRA